MDVPVIDKEHARRVDELAVDHYGIEIIQMMENAGRHVAELAKKMIKDVHDKNIVLLAGKGNNGGDALVAARFLANWGANCTVIFAEEEDKLHELTKKQAEILKVMDIIPLGPSDETRFYEIFDKAHIIIDGLLGYNIRGDPEDVYGRLIQLANDVGKHVLSIDVPSGLDPDTGMPYNPCIKAKATICLANVKKGCLEGKEYAGDIYAADIGLPPALYDILGIEVGYMFSEKDIIKI